jgi:hypothetical protein
MLVVIRKNGQEKVPLEEEIKKEMQKEAQRNSCFERTYKSIRENDFRGIQIFKNKKGIFRLKGRIPTFEEYPAIMGKEEKFLGMFQSLQHEKTLHSTAGAL